jgi:hypothetical protein
MRLIGLVSYALTYWLSPPDILAGFILDLGRISFLPLSYITSRWTRMFFNSLGLFALWPMEFWLSLAVLYSLLVGCFNLCSMKRQSV